MTMTKQRYLLWAILLTGLILRLAYGLSQTTAVYVGGGGDTAWYLANGVGLFSGQEYGFARGFTFYVSTIPTAPLYLIFTGFWQIFFSDSGAIIAIRVVQSLISMATIYFAYRMASVISRERRVGLVAAAALALHPTLIIDSAAIATETVYIFFVSAGLWLYVEWLVHRESNRIPPLAWAGLVGLALGLGTMTRAVLLLFPLGLVIHMMMLGGRTEWRVWMRRAAVLMVVYVAVVSVWTIYNLRWDRFVIASDQFVAAFWRGAVEDEGGHRDVDERFLGESYVDDGCVDCGVRVDEQAMLDDAAATISSDLGGYIRLRLGELVNAYLQPHGTIPLGGDSLKNMAGDWLQNDRSLSGLVELTQGEGFWPKLLIYILHYTGLIGGLAGMWLARHRWPVTLPLMGFILYTTLIHVVLIALPRYIFPTEAFFWVFSALTLVRLWDGLRHLWAKRITQSTEHTTLAEEPQ